MHLSSPPRNFWAKLRRTCFDSVKFCFWGFCSISVVSNLFKVLMEVELGNFHTSKVDLTSWDLIRIALASGCRWSCLGSLRSCCAGCHEEAKWYGVSCSWPSDFRRIGDQLGWEVYPLPTSSSCPTCPNHFQIISKSCPASNARNHEATCIVDIVRSKEYAE